MSEGGPPLYEFDPNKLNINDVILFVARKNSGKSTLVEYLLHKNKHRISRIVVFSSTENNNNFYSQFVPKSFIFAEETLDLEFLTALQEFQAQFGMSAKSDVEKQVIVILDDMMQDAGALKEKAVTSFVANGRHKGVGMWIMSQYLKWIPKSLRGNMDRTFALKEPVLSNRKALLDEVFGSFCGNSVEKNRFFKIFEEATDNWGALVQDNLAPTAEKSVCWIRATPVQRETPPECKYKWMFDNRSMYDFDEKYLLPESQWSGPCCAKYDKGSLKPASRKSSRVFVGLESAS